MNRTMRMTMVAIASLVTFAGCSAERSPMDPAAKRGAANSIDAIETFEGRFTVPVTARPGAGWSDFFPLGLGSVWTYEHHGKTTTSIPDGPTTVDEMTTHITSTMTETVDAGDLEYTVEIDVEDFGGGVSYERAIYWRQDASGLYEFSALRAADGARDARPSPSTTGPAAFRAAIERAGTESARAGWRRAEAALAAKRAVLAALRGGAGPNGGPTANELQRLAYPLRIGLTWVVREFPLFTMTVEGRDAILVDGRRLLGWRMRIESEFFSATDRVHVWYGEDGYLGLRARIRGPVTDIEGNPIGSAAYEEDVKLLTLDVVR